MSASIDLPKLTEAFRKIGEAYTSLADALSPSPDPTPKQRWHPTPLGPDPEPSAAPVIDGRKHGRHSEPIKGISRLARQLIIEDPTVTINDLVERLKTRHSIDPALLRRTTLSTLRYDTLVMLSLMKEHAVVEPGEPESPPIVRGAGGRFIEGSGGRFVRKTPETG